MEEVDEQAFSMREFREGSPLDFKKIFFRHYPELFSFAYSLLGDKASARHSTTDTFFLLWKKRRHFITGKDTRAFLYNTIRNNCCNYLKYRQIHPDVKEYFREIEMDVNFPDATLQELLAYVARVT